MSATIGPCELTFDPDELQSRCMSNLELSCRVLRAFLEQGERDLVALTSALERQCVEETQRLAHRLKGASDNVAARRIRDLSASLETSARAGTTDWSSWISTLHEEWKEFQRTARAYLSHMSKTHPESR